MSSALIVADTDLPPRALWNAQADAATLVVAADGGADRALAAGLDVDWVVGDLDGISKEALARIPKDRVRSDADIDTTDLQKVLRFLAAKKVAKATIIGAIGGRLDHTVGTLAILAEWAPRMDLEVIDADFTTTVVLGKAKVAAPLGTMVSLLSPSGARGVSTKGLRYELSNKDLPFSTLGIHNEVAKSPFEVRVEAGTLFLLRSHYVKRHR